VALEYTLLGMLLEKPGYGYSLKKKLAEQFSREFGVNDGLLYPALGRLESRGWIRKRVVPQAGKPARHVYSVTADGKRAFERWLEGPPPGEEPVRYDFYWRHGMLQRCAFLRHLEPARARAAVERELEEATRRGGDLERVVERMRAGGVDPYRRMIVEYGIRDQRMQCEWLEELLARIEEAERVVGARPRAVSG
jgi:PadR family transcriptional regulator AphA